MFKKIEEGIVRLSLFLEDLFKSVQEFLAPVIKVGTIISVIYSVLATSMLLQNKLPEFWFQFIRSIPFVEYVFVVLLVITMVTLLLSGGIVEAFRLFGFVFDAFDDYPISDDPDDVSILEFVFALIVFLIPFFVTALTVACIPTSLILVHNYRKRTEGK